MDLPTHFTFAFAMGLLFFNKPDVALLIALGSLFPDLDREYWFIPQKRYTDEQIHRAGLHNVFIMGISYLISPFFSLGIFFHILQDSFTTVKDRGVEWFYPLTRLIKRGMFDGNGNEQPLDPKEKIYFYQQDSKGLVDKADPDLREYGCEPVPWRRVYGFAQNSQILDRSFLYGSIVLILIWHFSPGNSEHLLSWTKISTNYYFGILVGYISILTLFVAGEMDRHNKISFVKVTGNTFNILKHATFGLGILLFVFWIVLFKDKIIENLIYMFNNPIAFSLAAIIIPISIVILIKQNTIGKSDAII
ncbi:MAG: metal-dependent hydrolase [Candidatus Nitrosocosmicus sp.]